MGIHILGPMCAQGTLIMEMRLLSSGAGKAWILEKVRVLL